MTSPDKISHVGHEEAARLALARSHFEPSEGLVRSIGHALKISADHLRAERVGMWLLETTSLRCLTVYTRSTGELGDAPPIPREACPAYFAAVQKRRSIVADDAITHRYTLELADTYLRPNRIGALVDAPVYRAGRVFGVVCHEHEGGPRKWTEAEITFAGGVADIVSTLLEQSETVALQARLKKAEAEAQLSRMAREIAHDFAQYLQVIGLASSFAPLRSDPAKMNEALDDIKDAHDRALALVRSLLGVGRALAIEPTLEKVDELVRGAEPLLSKVLDAKGVTGAARTTLVLRLAADASVRIDPGTFERILVNLVANARDAMPDGGAIEIATSVRKAGSTQRAYVVVEVRDHGTGIPESIRDKIFDPYFSTKDSARGTGLGLAFVRGAVEQQGGTVEVSSSPEGSTFRIWFPLVND